MSSKCILTIKNESWLKREIMLYQNTEGHPNSMLLSLSSELRDIYQEFKEHGDPDWFMDPGKLSGALTVRSVPVMTDEMRELLKKLPTAAKNRMESTLFLGMPALLPESKVYDVNYEYSITLKDNPEDRFYGFVMEVYKLQNNKRTSSITVIEENFIKDILLSTPLYEDA